MDSLIPIQLRIARNRRRMTLQRLSIDTGMSVQHLSQIETGGARGTQLMSIERIARTMGLSLMLVPEHLETEVASFIRAKGRSDPHAAKSIKGG